jgi:hypothetical protein
MVRIVLEENSLKHLSATESLPLISASTYSRMVLLMSSSVA